MSETKIAPLGPSRRRPAAATPGPFVATHPGMPLLDLGAPRYPVFKRLVSDQLFYAPAALMWLALSLRHGSLTLPSAANPAMEAGGLWGESKAQGLALFGPYARRWLAPWVVVARSGDAERDIAEAHAAMRTVGLSFPTVAKPDLGYQGWGVQKLDDEDALASYVRAFPAGQRFLLQHLVPFAGEAGVFYVRRPGAPSGKIISMALTYGPHVVGDGVATLGELISADPVLKKSKSIFFAHHAAELDRVPAHHQPVRLAFCASARLGSVYRDARHLVTHALHERIDAIARDIKGFHFGRFDLRFASIERFLAGEDFAIVELNGAGAEVLHIWDGRFDWLAAYRTLWRQYRTAFEIGAANARRGHRPEGIRGMIRRQRLQDRLRRIYPVSK